MTRLGRSVLRLEDTKDLIRLLLVLKRYVGFRGRYEPRNARVCYVA